MIFSSDDLMLLASLMQTKNKIQSFKLIKPTEDSAEIVCTKCDAKIDFYLVESNQFKIGRESKLQHNLLMHPEIAK